jgi:hypothetical protein
MRSADTVFVQDWSVEQRAEYVVVTLGESVSAESGRGAAAAVRRLLEASDRPLVVVVDARLTTSYEVHARVAAQAVLTMFRSRVARFVVVSDHAIIRIAAALIELSVGTRVDVRSTMPGKTFARSHAHYALGGLPAEHVRFRPAPRAASRELHSSRASVPRDSVGRTRRSVLSTQPKR